MGMVIQWENPCWRGYSIPVIEDKTGKLLLRIAQVQLIQTLSRMMDWMKSLSPP